MREAPTVVICEADRVVRSVVSGIVEKLGGRVIAESDRNVDVMDLVERFDPDVVVLEVVLAVGGGIEVLDHLQGRRHPCQVVFFTAYPDSVAGRQCPGVRVVGKPDYERLSQAIAAALGPSLANLAPAERRRTPRGAPLPALRDKSGLDDPAEFYRALGDARPGDALVGVRPGGLLEHVLAVVRATIRVQDLLMVRHGVVLVLLVGGGREGAASLLARLARLDEQLVAGAHSVVLDGSLGPTEALAEVSSTQGG